MSLKHNPLCQCQSCLGNHSSLVVDSACPGKPKAGVYPNTFSFGSVVAGATSVPQVAVLKNEGTADLLVKDIVITGPFDYSIDMAVGGVLFPGSQANITITFKPVDNGVVSGSIYLDTDSIGGNEFILMSGEGIGSGSNMDGYAAWPYNNGSALGGEQDIVVPDLTSNIPFAYLNGFFQFAGYSYTFDPATHTVHLSKPLEPEDELVLMLSGDFNDPTILLDSAAGRVAREALRRTYAEAGYNLVDGSFDTGGTVDTATDVLLNEVDGKAYSWGGTLPKSVSAGELPSVGWIPHADASLKSGVMMSITSPSLAGGAVAGQDSTAALNAAGALGGTFYVPKGEYVLSNVNIAKDITFICEKGAVFKRAPGLDIRQSYWATGVPMFEPSADGLNITFVDPVFDGNNANQPVVQVGYTGPDATTEPAGWAFRYTPINAATAKNCRFSFIRPTFKNGTSGYLLIRGDDINRRFKTEVVLDNPIFTDTVYGYGKSDPATPTPLGWSPDYITMMDYVDLYGVNVQMTYSGAPTPVGRYAPVGIRVTYYSTAANAGGGSVYLIGRTVLRGMGRKNQSYDGANYTNSNGIGAIDGYGEAQNLYIELLDGELCESISARAKATIGTYHVGKAILLNCKHGVQVSPGVGSTGARVHIGDVYARGGTNPQVEIVGTSLTSQIASLYLGDCDVSGGVNEENLVSNIAGIVIRNVKDVETGFLCVANQDRVGVQFNQNGTVKSSGRISNTVGDGLVLDTIADSVDVDFVVNGAGGRGVYAAGACKAFRGKFVVDGAVNYGIQANIPDGNVVIENSHVDNISGLSRGYFIGSAGGSISDSSVGANVTTPVQGTNVLQIVQHNNSWNPRTQMYSGSINAPTTGTYRRGDITYIPAASAGFIGWVCTTAGIAGSTAVFKRFGAIEA